MPTVSVIMGIYNCEDTLADSLYSIINQTYTDWELIMCDDCSTDKTYTVAKEFADKYGNIVLIKNEQNMGLAFSLNKCLEVAKGQYIARTDGDDICLQERFQVQVDFLNNNPHYHIVGSSVILYDETGDKAIRHTIETPSKYDLVKGVPFIHPTIMMRKEIYDILGGYTVSKRTKRGQDADLWYKLFAQGFKGYNIQMPLLKYHESIKDYKKRSLKVRWMGMQTRFIGYRRLRLPVHYYIFVFKPLVTALIPKNVMYYYHKSMKEKKDG
jgi:glycosyltransferase EpsE